MYICYRWRKGIKKNISESVWLVSSVNIRYTNLSGNGSSSGHQPHLIYIQRKEFCFLQLFTTKSRKRKRRKNNNNKKKNIVFYKFTIANWKTYDNSRLLFMYCIWIRIDLKRNFRCDVMYNIFLKWMENSVCTSIYELVNCLCVTYTIFCVVCVFVLSLFVVLMHE